jgi:hypothetical protein
MAQAATHTLITAFIMCDGITPNIIPAISIGISPGGRAGSAVRRKCRRPAFSPASAV